MKNTAIYSVIIFALLFVASCAQKDADESLKIIPKPKYVDPWIADPGDTLMCTPPVNQTHFYSDTIVLGLVDPQYNMAFYDRNNPSNTDIIVSTSNGELDIDFGMRPVKTGVYRVQYDYYRIKPGKVYMQFTNNFPNVGYPEEGSKIYVKVNEVTGQTTISFCHIRIKFINYSSSGYWQNADGSLIF